MAKDLRYWDANAFSGFLNGEEDKVDQCQGVLKAAENGHVLIVTSALTLAEVLFIRGGPKLPPEKRKTVEDFFKNDYIAVRNVTRHVGEVARDVFWEYGIKPKDAVHVATAILEKIPVFNTFDGPLLGKDGLTMNGHNLKIEKPYVPEQMELDVESEEAATPKK